MLLPGSLPVSHHLAILIQPRGGTTHSGLGPLQSITDHKDVPAPDMLIDKLKKPTLGPQLQLGCEALA